MRIRILDLDLIRHSKFRIRPNDADPCGSGSVTLIGTPFLKDVHTYCMAKSAVSVVIIQCSIITGILRFENIEIEKQMKNSRKCQIRIFVHLKPS
jgi:hypothetical protein